MLDEKSSFTLIAALIPAGYVGSLYAFDRARLYKNHPATIRRRFLGVGVCTSTALTATFALLRAHGYSIGAAVKLMSIRLDANAVEYAIYTSASVLVAYAGTALIEAYETPSVWRWSWFGKHRIIESIQ